MNDYIKRIIENLKIKFNTTCPYKLANDLDIILIIEDLGKVMGMYKYIKKNKVIFLNSNLKEEERKFVLAHEIGHAILHTKSSCFFSTTTSINKIKKEYEANLFAAELLIDFKDVDSLYLKGYSIANLASYYKVPIELIEFKFKENKRNNKHKNFFL